MIILGFDNAAGEPSIEYDVYTPITVTWDGYRRSLGALTSVGLNGNGGYLELKFESTSGTLEELVLVSAIAKIGDGTLPVSAFGRPARCPIAALPDSGRSQHVR